MSGKIQYKRARKPENDGILRVEELGDGDGIRLVWHPGEYKITECGPLPSTGEMSIVVKETKKNK